MKPLLGNQVVTQIGLLVHDIEKASRDYAAFLGVEPPQIRETDIMEKAQTTYMGSPTRARARLAFFQVGPQVQLELIQPDQHPSTWRRDLDARGEGFHHIAFQIKGMKQTIAACQGEGMALLQTGEYTGGRYAYLDANDKLKLVLELLEND